MPPDEVVVATMSDRYSAEFVVARLADAGIPARINAKVEPSWTTGSPTRVMPVEVRVPASRAAEAREILAEAEGESPEGDGREG